MRQDLDNRWNEIEEKESGSFNNPVPGGYIARIVRVEDVEQKEYLKIEWDFADGQYKGNNKETYDRAGFWPITLMRSYKDNALGFFKAFKTSVENSNPGYIFTTKNPRGLEGKFFGVIIGEEEYEHKSGEIRTRLYVHSTRSVSSIQEHDFDVPVLKKLKARNNTGTNNALNPTGRTYGESWREVYGTEDTDGELPF